MKGEEIVKRRIASDSSLILHPSALPKFLRVAQLELERPSTKWEVAGSSPAMEAKIFGPILVGPILVGPILVGPILVGPILVGPILVG
jgi:hypothetical protein